ncbi:hypothetical protein [Vibrio parahaemolyticus]|uniref:hypothetical protein n=1 Tax=Vibrio parahaemolyticus TaxID=670 RepID=UPI001124A9EF|nr:hypothetical protein [Vibrio parahaemolyticus]EIU6870788.1 hypothetical protein [Vibrio parahaemolyticus]TOH65778.1 hypothetical protein CGI76_22975 [Vibrio parahaemolyticus]TOI58878.1 hypothetical protein CGI55_25175 [Vibrio parahaemolyticus]
MLDNDLIRLIDDKARDLNSKSDVAKEVAKIVKNLNLYIDEEVTLNQGQVDRYLSILGGYFSTSLYIPLDPGTKFLRARAFDLHHLEDEVSELSYLPESKKQYARQGRFNQKGAPIFYACIYFDGTGGLNVGFSEINAEPEKSVNVLRSKNVNELNVYYVGIYDLVYRDSKPRFMPDDMFNKYREVYEYQETKFSRQAFLAHQVCDAFFSDILRRKEHGNLYNVTSRLPQIFLSEEAIDGIIYTSVKAEGAPVVALKCNSVDQKLVHESCEAFEIQYDFGYARYQALNTHIGTICDNQINWVHKT